MKNLKSKTNAFVLFLSFIILIGCAKDDKDNKYNIIVKDDLGIEVSFTEMPKRIISTAPNITEIIYKLNCEDKLIGVTKYCDFPAEAKQKTIIGDLISVNIEKIIELKPDVVFVTMEGNTKLSYNKLIDLGIKVVVTNPRNLFKINTTINMIAEIFNKEKLADSILKDINERIKNIASNNQKLKTKTGMFLISPTPIMLAGDDTFINEIMELSGIKNIVHNSPVRFPLYNREEILKMDPDYIIIPAAKEFDKNELLKTYKEWKNLKAIKNNNIIFVNQDIFFRPGPRYIEAIEILAKEINKN